MALPVSSRLALTPMMSAPASARPWAMATPMPRLQPVTRAVFPERPKDFMDLAEFGNFDAVHVGEGLVFAAHRPTEAVAGGAAAGVDGPRRREHDLAIGHPQRAGFLRLAHHVKDAVGGGNVEITIDLAAAVVGVARHGVPDAAGLEFRKAHDELTAPNAVFVDVLEDGALVALVLGTEFHAVCIGAGGLGRGVVGVGRVADEVENSRLGGRCAGEGNFPAAATDVEAVVGTHFVGGAIDG